MQSIKKPKWLKNEIIILKDDITEWAMWADGQNHTPLRHTIVDLLETAQKHNHNEARHVASLVNDYLYSKLVLIQIRSEKMKETHKHIEHALRELYLLNE